MKKVTIIILDLISLFLFYGAMFEPYLVKEVVGGMSLYVLKIFASYIKIFNPYVVVVSEFVSGMGLMILIVFAIACAVSSYNLCAQEDREKKQIK